LVYEERIPEYPSKRKIGEEIRCSTEAEIFKELEIPYREPHQREVFDFDVQQFASKQRQSLNSIDSDDESP
jgi:hypothetical protein